MVEVERDVCDMVFVPKLHLHIAGNNEVLLIDCAAPGDYDGGGLTELHRCQCGAVRYFDRKHKVLTPWTRPDDENYRSYEAALKVTP
jgi:hypothetical protein